MANFQNEKLGVKMSTADLTQGMLEKYLERLQGKEKMPVGKYYGEMLRAAIEVGWVTDPSWTPEQLAEQKPPTIRWMGSMLDKQYALETTVPPE